MQTYHISQNKPKEGTNNIVFLRKPSLNKGFIENHNFRLTLQSSGEKLIILDLVLLFKISEQEIFLSLLTHDSNYLGTQSMLAIKNPEFRNILVKKDGSMLEYAECDADNSCIKIIALSVNSKGMSYQCIMDDIYGVTHSTRAVITNWIPIKYIQSSKLREIFLMSSGSWPSSTPASAPSPWPPPLPPTPSPPPPSSSTATPTQDPQATTVTIRPKLTKFLPRPVMRK